MNDTETKFDAVYMMRSIRDKLSENTNGMTLEEELRWLAMQELNDPFLQHLRSRFTQQEYYTNTKKHINVA